MIPVNFNGANVRLEPSDPSSSDVVATMAYRYTLSDGRTVTATLWMPSYEDLQALQRGQGIWLEVMGGSMVPVRLFTTDEHGNPND